MATTVTMQPTEFGNLASYYTADRLEHMSEDNLRRLYTQLGIIPSTGFDPATASVQNLATAIRNYIISKPATNLVDLEQDLVPPVRGRRGGTTMTVNNNTTNFFRSRNFVVGAAIVGFLLLVGIIIFLLVNRPPTVDSTVRDAVSNAAAQKTAATSGSSTTVTSTVTTGNTTGAAAQNGFAFTADQVTAALGTNNWQVSNESLYKVHVGKWNPVAKIDGKMISNVDYLGEKFFPKAIVNNGSITGYESVTISRADGNNGATAWFTGAVQANPNYANVSNDTSTTDPKGAMEKNGAQILKVEGTKYSVVFPKEISKFVVPANFDVDYNNAKYHSGDTITLTEERGATGWYLK